MPIKTSLTTHEVQIAPSAGDIAGEAKLAHSYPVDLPLSEEDLAARAQEGLAQTSKALESERRHDELDALTDTPAGNYPPPF